MAKISQYFKDKAKTIKDYPKTLIKAVYGDDGKRLDNIISDITSDIDSTKAKIGVTDISQYSDGTVTGAIKSACDKANTNEAAIADVNNKLGNTDISAIGDGTVTGGLDALNSNLNKYLMIHLFEIGWLPNAFEPNKVIFSFITASLIGANGAYVPIFTCAWYDTSVVSAVWQFAITIDGVKRRYNTSATSWSDWI